MNILLVPKKYDLKLRSSAVMTTLPLLIDLANMAGELAMSDSFFAERNPDKRGFLA